ncbi:glycosyl transferase family protein [Sphingopyxis sp. MWB1]|uniref:glycosyl transferase family protein n=1 Tax=Sphingopyxis sp. MWB1 TaxID=1537715 RepID=UPI00051A153A|nr:glycosyl transferase family protein [Sphingopyxis sp. MWB1]
MEYLVEWLGWLTRWSGHELLLFASVGILVIGLDDLLFDILWLLKQGHGRKKKGPLHDMPALEGRIAIFVAAWDEAGVLPLMLRRALDAWRGDDFRIYLGCYPNDSATLFSIARLVRHDPRIRLVIGPHDGPTTKGDNLNRLWDALCADEQVEDKRYVAVVLHDAEDYVHAEELALYRRMLVSNAMVQIPVVPFLDPRSRWVGGHYGDEFAEAHGKELVLRSALGLPIPSAGVGCAITRNAMALLALERGGQPFRVESLTEDYEIGVLIGAYGLKSCFADRYGAEGDHIVSRGSFPGDMRAAIRQKARWITGIALAGWAQLGWPTTKGQVFRWRGKRVWLTRWMLWRDRRAPLAAIVILAAYVALVLGALDLLGQHFLGWPTRPWDVAMSGLLLLNAALLIWRLGIRGHFTGRWYGWKQAWLALPRAFVANFIAIFAAGRALVTYCQMLRSGRIYWDKTSHHVYDDGIGWQERPVQ